MKALKHTEELVGIFHVEAYAIVPDINDGLLCNDSLADFDHRRLTRARIFDCVRQKIKEHLLHQTGVTIDVRQVVDVPADVTIRGLVLQGRQYFFYQCLQTGHLCTQFLAAHARQTKQVVHHSTHLLRAVDNGGNWPRSSASILENPWMCRNGALRS